MYNNERPVIVAVHKKLETELKERQNQMRQITGRKSRGGLTVFSELVAYELNMIRKSGDEIYKKLSQFNKENKPIIINNQKYVTYESYKKLFILCSILNKKKDQRQINIDVSKIKGLKKNELKLFW